MNSTLQALANDPEVKRALARMRVIPAPTDEASQHRIMAHVIEEVIESSGFTLKDLQSPSRVRALVEVRHRAMSALRQKGYSSSAIGRFLNRDSSSVWLALREGAA